jgi:D-Tyr-tRNAtyr deacylase
MKLFAQRVTEAAVLVAGEVVFPTGRGILCFVGIHKNDKDGDADWIAQKLLSMFYWEADDGTPWKKGIPEIQSEVTVAFEPGLVCEVAFDSRPATPNLMDSKDAEGPFAKVVAKSKAADNLVKVFTAPFAGNKKPPRNMASLAWRKSIFLLYLIVVCRKLLG